MRYVSYRTARFQDTLPCYAPALSASLTYNFSQRSTTVFQWSKSRD